MFLDLALDRLTSPNATANPLVAGEGTDELDRWLQVWLCCLMPNQCPTTSLASTHRDVSVSRSQCSLAFYTICFSRIPLF